jgi:hypothetical protein
MPFSTILESIVVLPSVKSNSCDYLKMKENVQQFHLCSGFSHIFLSDCPVYKCNISKNNNAFIVQVSMYVYWKLYKNGFYETKKES